MSNREYGLLRDLTPFLVMAFGLATPSVRCEESGSKSPPVAARPDVSSVRERLLQSERERIELIERLTPAVVCIFDDSERGGGSGVLIDAQGYGLTNYHVLAGMINSRKGWAGLSDGKKYELEVLGVDPTGDVAMFRITGLDTFSFAELGDSDAVVPGDTVLALGNPFSLSEDYTPTVTMGIVTGIHRYQWGSGNSLIYSDSIQIDASINPGSSGGPLFDAAGRIIGINGRISVSTRGRLNVGFGYAISCNQIKRFMPSMRAGLLAKHGTLQATVEDVEGRGVVFNQVLRNAVAAKAGVLTGDRLLELDGIPIESRNQLASLIGTYPADWPVPLRIEREGQEQRMMIRLEPITAKKAADFTVNRGVNVRQIQDVLSRFRRLALGTGGDSVWPNSWSWSVARVHALSADGNAKPAERWDVVQQDDDPAIMQQRYDGGAMGRTIEYTDQTALWKSAAAGDQGPSGERFEVPLEARLVLTALYVLQRKLGSEPTVNDLHPVDHLGGYALLPTAEDSPDATNASRISRVEPLLTELIAWPLGEHAVARFAFDERNPQCVRITVLDVPSSQEVVVELSNYRDVGGITWPCTMRVRGAGLNYTDSLSGFKIEKKER